MKSVLSGTESGYLGSRILYTSCRGGSVNGGSKWMELAMYLGELKDRKLRRLGHCIYCRENITGDKKEPWALYH